VSAPETFVVVVEAIGVDLPGGTRDRDDALARFSTVLAEHPGLFDPYTGNRLRVVSEQQWLMTAEIRARQEAAR
jgi:hypothetical protein